MDLTWVFDDALQARRDRLKEAGYDAYCLHCVSGREVAAAYGISQHEPTYLAMPFRRLMYQSRKGERTLVQDTLLKGYLFLFVPRGEELIEMQERQYVYSVLGQAFEEKALTGADLQYAEWVLSLGGVIGLSQAVRLDERVEIIGGPLLHYEGWIKEYSKKNRNCRVEIDVLGKRLNAWLPFEWVESREHCFLENMGFEG